MLFGLAIGIVVGLFIGPLVRSWLAWREYVDASREAQLHEELFRLLSDPLAGEEAGEEERAEDPLGHFGSP
jgi:hypothetical protein